MDRFLKVLLPSERVDYIKRTFFRIYLYGNPLHHRIKVDIGNYSVNIRSFIFIFHNKKSLTVST